MGKVYDSFPNLFRKSEGQDSGDDESDRGSEDGIVGNFNDKWGWLYQVESVSKTYGCDWDKVMEMPLIMFLNLICYNRDKDAFENAMNERWKMSH